VHPHKHYQSEGAEEEHTKGDHVAPLLLLHRDRTRGNKK
jgi:hypothetical protein